MRNCLLWLCSALIAGPVSEAHGQSASVSAGAGSASGTVSAPGLPPVSVEAGGGQARVVPDAGAPSPGALPPPLTGRSMTVQSPGGSAAAGAWVSGPGSVAVSGAGPPGAVVHHQSYGVPKATAKKHPRARHKQGKSAR